MITDDEQGQKCHSPTAFASRKFSPSATVLKLFSSALFFSDFKFFRPSEALARENFPISNVSRPRVVLYFLRRRRPFLNFYLPPCWWSQKARVNCSFPISKFPRRRRSFLNFHTALLMIATGAHTQTKSTSGKKNCFRFAKIFAFGDGAEVIF